MTIERISFSGGLLIKETRGHSLGQIIAENAGKAKPLSPGEYDLTPTAFTDHTFNYSLSVHDDGTATFRMTPRPTNFSAIISRGVGITRGQEELSTPISADKQVGIIARPSRNGPGI